MSIHTGAMSDPDLDWGIYPSARMQFGSARTASPMHLTDGKDDPYAEYPPPQRRASRCSLCAAVMCALVIILAVVGGGGYMYLLMSDVDEQQPASPAPHTLGAPRSCTTMRPRARA